MSLRPLPWTTLCANICFILPWKSSFISVTFISFIVIIVVIDDADDYSSSNNNNIVVFPFYSVAAATVLSESGGRC